MNAGFMRLTHRANVLIDNVKQQTAPLLSEAVGQYQLKGIGKAKTFHQAALRNVGLVIDQLGDRPLCDYSTVDAGTYVMH